VGTLISDLLDEGIHPYQAAREILRYLGEAESKIERDNLRVGAVTFALLAVAEATSTIAAEIINRS
jgi:uncharacterized protein with HEPN domain